MPKSFKSAATDPRIVMRVIIGVLLAANLALAVIVFHPFGGSAEDLARQREALATQLTKLHRDSVSSKGLVDKVQTARRQSDEFLSKYVVARRSMASSIPEALVKIAEQTGGKLGQVTYGLEPVEGSDTLSELTISAGFEGPYAALLKFVNQIDRSPRFFIIDSMTASSPQGAQQTPGEKPLNVTFRIRTYVRDDSGSAL